MTQFDTGIPEILRYDNVATNTGLERGEVKELAKNGKLAAKCQTIFSERIKNLNNEKISKIQSDSFEMNETSAKFFISKLGDLNVKETPVKTFFYFNPSFKPVLNPIFNPDPERREKKFYVPAPNMGIAGQYFDDEELNNAYYFQDVFIFKKGEKCYINLEKAKIGSTDRSEDKNGTVATRVKDIETEHAADLKRKAIAALQIP